MKTLIALVLLLSPPFTSGQNKTDVSLKETLQWMDNTFNGGRRGLFQQWDMQNKLSAEETFAFKYDECTITETIQQGPDCEEAKHMWGMSREITFRLGDIDPSTIQVVPHSSRYMTDCLDPAEVKATDLDCSNQAEVRFLTSNENSAISYKSHMIFRDIPEGRPDHESRLSGTESCGAFAMYDAAYARRFAEAFRHAVELCGGKPSAF